MKKMLAAVLVLVVALGGAVGAGALEPQEKSIIAGSLNITKQVDAYNTKRGIPQKIVIDDIYDIDERNSAFTVSEDGGLAIRFQENDGVIVLVSVGLTDTSAPPFELFLATVDTAMQIVFPELNGDQRSILILDAVRGGVGWGTFAAAGQSASQEGNCYLVYHVKRGNAREVVLVKAK